MKQPRTICANCAFCIVKLEPPPTKMRTRLDYRCKMVRHDKTIDPVTGKECFVTHEAKFITDEEHPNCIDMNPQGECSMYMGAEG